MPLDPKDHFKRLARLMKLEAEAQAKQTLESIQQLSASAAERSGQSLTGLVIAEETSGLGGRCILRLTKRNRTLALPWNRLEPGTPILLSAAGSKDGDGWRGVVCDRHRYAISVAVNEPPEEEDRAATYRLDLSTDETARQRQTSALEKTAAAKRERLAELRDVLLGAKEPEFKPALPLVPLNTSLNTSQQEAIAFALSARDLAILHGPPGTGKTTAVVELIRQAVQRGQKVLACAPSNLAVDNMLERLLAGGEKAVRLGHPARVLPELREHTLDLMIEDHDGTRQARKMAKKAFALFRQAGKYTRAKPEPGSRQALRQEGRALLADARKLEDQVVERILNGATVVCATLTGINAEILGERVFDLAVIDEAGQSTEPICWLPVLRSKSLVLAGDHCQLPPTILSREAAQEGFGISLMERLVDCYGPKTTRLLKVQYRMHESIMTHSARTFYDSELEAHESVRGHLLCDLPGVQANALTQTPVEFIDTAGASYDEETEADGKSRLNPQEADLVVKKVQALLDAGVPASGIAVIAPYSAQVRLLREKLSRLHTPRDEDALAEGEGHSLEIDSVDGFQGREKEVVILSLVRSNPEGDVGFLADVRRMNVALTRARRKLLVIGDSATLASHPFYEGLFAYFEAIGAHRSVWEE